MGLPVEINPLLISSSGYVVGRSLRFRSSASAYLSRTPASASNRQKWTLSFWAKLGAAVATGNWCFLSARVDDNNRTTVLIQNNQILLQNILSGVTASAFTSAVYRDPSAWYHVNIVYDSAQATASNRFYVYVNNVLQVTTGSYPAQNDNSFINFNTVHGLGRIEYSGPTGYFDGYFAEINLIDGQALTPSSFGAYDTNGVWQPLKYGGTYGTNGFYLPFSDTTSTTTLCYDKSGNGNNWTPNNISLTAGTTYDSMIDSPTVSASSSNYCVFNPIQPQSNVTFSEGNLKATHSNNQTVDTTIGVFSGKWYFELTVGAIGTRVEVGIAQNYNWAVEYLSTGNKNVNGTSSAYGATWTTGDIIGCAFDIDSGTATFYKNGVSQGQITGITYYSDRNFPTTYGSGTPNYFLNFGQRPFSYTPPSGYSALNTYNLPTPTIANGATVMAATTYTGTGGNQTILNSNNTTTGVSFKPDLVWLKDRTASGNHQLFNSIVGAGTALASNLTNAEFGSGGLNAFNSNGFSGNIGSTDNYVAWQWNAGSGSSSSNTSGSITSTVSANTTAGFSVVTYTGNSLTNQTVGHGLGVAPSMIIIKNRDSAYDWIVGHTSTSFNGYLYLNSTGAYVSSSNPFNNTAPTSTVFTIAGNAANPNVNLSTTKYVAYCFAAVRGYSAFGSYTGNGSTDGPFVYTNFRPRYVLIKNITFGSQLWFVYDTSRSPYNLDTAWLAPNNSNAEAGSSTDNPIDILSNGFKIRYNNTGTNQNGDTYIYAAFAENPFNYSRAR